MWNDHYPVQLCKCSRHGLWSVDLCTICKDLKQISSSVWDLLLLGGCQYQHWEGIWGSPASDRTWSFSRQDLAFLRLQGRGCALAPWDSSWSSHFCLLSTLRTLLTELPTWVWKLCFNLAACAPVKLGISPITVFDSRAVLKTVSAAIHVLFLRVYSDSLWIVASSKESISEALFVYVHSDT